MLDAFLDYGNNKKHWVLLITKDNMGQDFLFKSTTRSNFSEKVSLNLIEIYINEEF